MKSITVFIFKKLRFLTFVLFTKNLIFIDPIKEGNKIIAMHRSSLWESPTTYRLKDMEMNLIGGIPRKLQNMLLKIDSEEVST